MSEKIVILGAGIAGCIAYHALRDKTPLIVEAKPQVSVFKTHEAIMRLRDDDVAKFIGAESKKIEIQKAVFHNGKFEDPPSILSNNLYSIKLYNELGKRSMLKPGTSERYLLPNGYPVPENILWEKKVNGIYHNNLRIYHNNLRNYLSFADGSKIEYDHCISTLPMPVMHGFITVPKSEQKIVFEALPVYVKQIKMKIPSEVNQTIYYPSNSTPIYRATIQSSTLILESMESFQEMTEEDEVEVDELILESFGIDIARRTTDPIPKVSVIHMGKIKSISEEDRLRFILWLTDEFRVYSFGRYSVWKPLRTDELMDDIFKIKKIISAKGIIGDYKNRLR